MKNYLLISLPQSHTFEIYRESETSGNTEVRFQPFSKSDEPILFHANRVDVLPENIDLEVEKRVDHLYSKEEYEKLLDRTINHIKKEDLGKIVISRKDRFPLSRGVLDLFKTLVKKYPNACVYLLLHERAGVWMGATPELLLKGEQGLLQTMSLAGTREEGDEDTFEEKEELEQQLVTNYIIKGLDSFRGISNVQLEDRAKVRAGNLYHFINRIHANYSDQFSLNDFFWAFHPTPAVGGFPKQQALDFIEKNEKHQRSLYSGFFGIRNKSEFTYFVNLRCMQLFKNTAVLYAGGGITSDSDPEKEWDETNAKMRTLLNVLIAPEN